LTGESDIEDLGRMSREEVEQHYSKMLSALLVAHREALLRLAREIEELKSRAE
jgi:hypothetical protein